MTDELKTVYHIQTEIWHLFKKYGVCSLDDAAWDDLCAESNQLFKKYAADNPDMGQLFKDMYTALINYYRRKESGQ
mgnify:FL=1|jgi:hypothetical protein